MVRVVGGDLNACGVAGWSADRRPPVDLPTRMIRVRGYQTTMGAPPGVAQGKRLAVKHTLGLLVLLSVVWLLWSGHTEPFLLCLGALSVFLVLVICRRMRIMDDETVPLGLRFWPCAAYVPWLTKEIARANLDVARRILAKEMPIHPRMIRVRPSQRTDLGRVIYANSITLTPGTVSVDMQVDGIRVHALSAAEAEEDLSGEMDRRVTALERGVS